MNALQLNYWLKQHWKVLLLSIFAVLVLAQVIYQIVYPSSRLIPGTVVDGVNVGGKKYADAAKALDAAYGDLTLSIFFGDNSAAFQKPKMSEVGIGVDSSARLQAITYPFYLRFIPTSIWWAPSLSKPGDIAYTYDKNKIADYTTSKVGSDCSIKPQNASLKLIDTQLQLVPSIAGGQCDINEFQAMLAKVQPSADTSKNKVTISINPTPAPVTDDMARDLAAKLNSRMATPMPITVDTATDQIPGRVVLSWLDFTADVPKQSLDNSANQSASLKYAVNSRRLEDYLDQGIAAKLIKKPGVSKVSTLDFTETSRVNGASGRGVDMVGTTKSVEDYISGKVQKATGVTQVVGPTTVYTRSYSPTSVGFSALLAQYAQDNPGTYGLAFTELSNVAHLRSATYNADARFPAAGIHSLYLAYTKVMQQAAGIARPVDIVDGSRNLDSCFQLMLQQFDEACRIGMYKYFGYATIASRGKEIGLKNTVFAGEDTLTSANDIQGLLVGLYKNVYAKDQGGSTILNALRSNRDSDGIPAGVADQVQESHAIGESDTSYNDAGIVYSSHGSYAITILSKDAGAWDRIAGLVKKIEALKAVKVPANAR